MTSKRIRATVAAAALAVFMLPAHVMGQGTTLPPHVRVGLGVAISDTKDLLATLLTQSSVVIAPNVLVPIDLTPRLRLEPEVGYYRVSQAETRFYGSSTETISNTHAGLGVFAVQSREKFKLHVGGRVGYVRNSHTNNTGGSVKDNGFFIGPAVGGEYFFLEQLSLGGEVQLRYLAMNRKDDSDDVSVNSVSTHAGIVLRFYLK